MAYNLHFKQKINKKTHAAPLLSRWLAVLRQVSKPIYSSLGHHALLYRGHLFWNLQKQPAQWLWHISIQLHSRIILRLMGE